MVKESGILDYIRGRRRGKEAHRLEREALNDPFLADALEGLEQSGNHYNAINDLQRQVHFVSTEASRRTHYQRRLRRNYYLLGAAAVLLLVVVLTPFLYISVKHQQLLATLEVVQEAPAFDEDIPVTQTHLPSAPKKLPSSSLLAKHIILADNDTQISKSIDLKKDVSKVVAFSEKVKADTQQLRDIMITAAAANNHSKEESTAKTKTLQAIEMQEILDEEVPISAVLVEEKPKFMGSTDISLFSAWVQKRLLIPDEYRENSIHGKVIVQFVVNTDGKLSDVEIVRSFNSVLDAEAVRVIKSSPAWTPAKHLGKPVSVKYVIPVNFKW